MRNPYSKLGPVLALLILFGLGACVSSPKPITQERSDSAKLTLEGSQTAGVSVETDVDENLPKMEFDQALLEQVLISNFASYAADWLLGADNALMAAQTSQDYRLARLASLLALRAKNYPLATKAAELWINLDGPTEDAQTTLLLAHLGSGDGQAAYKEFDRQQEDQSIEEYVKGVAGLLVRQSNADVAIDVAEFYLQAYPDNAQLALSFAYVAESFKRNDLLASWLQRALDLRPEWDTAAQMQLSLLRREGKEAEAAAYIKDYVARYPSSVGMRINHAAEIAREKDYEAALHLMQAVLRDDKDNVPALSYSAALAQQLDKNDLAKEYFQKVLEIDSSNDEARWSLASFAVAEEKYSEAERYYQAVQGERNYFQAQLQIANMLYRMKGIKAAIKQIQSLDPKTETDYVGRATTQHYLLMEDLQYEEAYSSINEALVFLPNNVELLYSRGLVAAELKEIEVAEGDLRSIIAAHPDHANALNALGYTLADQTDRYQEAKELVLKALTLRPNDMHILDSMGWVLYRLKEYDGAIKYLQKAYDESAEVEVAAHLGEVLWESGDVEKARQIWRAAIAKDANNPVLIDTLERYGFTSDSSLKHNNLATDSVSHLER